ncbi:MATE family efflux transporter [Pseudohalocynthiibacter aestuariivivens]|nr:MATE family efflux transporter [Pseudohalocynthiibacter aestuariivivens]
MRHVSVMSLTSSIGLMAIFAVDLIDILFISMLGQEALAAAAGYASTVMFFASAINIGLSIAAGALVSRALGGKDEQDAQEFAASVAVIAVIVGLLVPLLALPNMTWLLSLIGAEGEVAIAAERYLWIILPTTAISGLGMTAVAVLRAYGDAGRAMYPALVGGTVNAVLDPILIFSLGMGLDGAAVATVLARIATMLTAFYPAIRRYAAFSLPRTRCIVRDFRMTSQIAIPAVLATIATPVGFAIVTREMANHGTDAVAALAVINRMTPVVFAVVLALSGAIGPIIGQNFGAGQMERVREAFFDGLTFVALYVIAVSVLLFILRGHIADLFDATGEMQALIFLFCGPLALATFFNGAIFVANASFNNLGHPGYSTWINWGRHTIGTWPLVIGGAALWGAPGVLIGQAAGGVIFAVIAVWLSLRVIGNPTVNPPVPHFQYKDLRMHVMCNRNQR